MHYRRGRAEEASIDLLWYGDCDIFTTRETEGGAI